MVRKAFQAVLNQLHGGKGNGPLTKKGKERARKAAFRHGAYTKEAKQLHRDAMDLIRKSKDLIKKI
ncbi:MAG: hypothetical protein H7A40_03630 [Chlamydiales bacterium]|nr:hypothetical protein [Chlamydiales bacterium]